jgi:hypothetical protein
MILAAEVSGDGFEKLIGQKRAITALSYPHCQPLNASHIKLGWYDGLKSDVMPAPVSDICMTTRPRILTYNHQGPRPVLRHGYVIPSR